MRRGRLTIAGLIALVALTGLGLAALRSPSPLVAQMTVTFALTCLLIATLAAIVSAYRVPAIGFALFGWLYLFLVFAPVCADRIAPWLLSSRMLDEVYFRTVGADGVFGAIRLRTPSGGAWEGEALISALSFRPDERRFLQFRMIGHAIFAVAHGLFGGLVAILLTRGRRRKAGAQP